MPSDNRMKIVDVSGPFREPREPALSYDYLIQRPTWATPHTARVKVGLAEELDLLKGKILGTVTGTPGQQLIVSQVLSRRIADEKLRIAEAEGMLSDRREIIVPPFVESLAHLLVKVEAWADQQRDALREELKTRVKL